MDLGKAEDCRGLEQAFVLCGRAGLRWELSAVLTPSLGTFHLSSAHPRAGALKAPRWLVSRGELFQHTETTLLAGEVMGSGIPLGFLHLVLRSRKGEMKCSS